MQSKLQTLKKIAAVLEVLMGISMFTLGLAFPVPQFTMQWMLIMLGIFFTVEGVSGITEHFFKRKD